MEEQQKDMIGSNNIPQNEITGRPRELQPPPLPQLINQLEDLVRMALEAEQNKEIPSVSYIAIMKDLVVIQKALDVISKDQEEIDAFLKVAKDRYGPLPEEVTAQKPEEAKVLKKLQDLQTLCEGARERLHAEISKNPEAERALREKVEDEMSSKKRKTTRRKRKFRSMGGDEGWIKT